MKNLSTLFMLSLTSALAISRDSGILAGRRSHGHVLIARGTVNQDSGTKDNRPQLTRPSSPSSRVSQLSPLSKPQNLLDTAVSRAPRSPPQSPSARATNQALEGLPTGLVTKYSSNSKGSPSSSSKNRRSRPEVAAASTGAVSQKEKQIASEY